MSLRSVAYFENLNKNKSSNNFVYLKNKQNTATEVSDCIKRNHNLNDCRRHSYHWVIPIWLHDTNNRILENKYILVLKFIDKILASKRLCQMTLNDIFGRNIMKRSDKFQTISGFRQGETQGHVASFTKLV